MIVFQLTPCRLYPKIVKLIKQQFSKATHIHEVFCLKDKYKSKFYPLPLFQINLKTNNLITFKIILMKNPVNYSS